LLPSVIEAAPGEKEVEEVAMDKPTAKRKPNAQRRDPRSDNQVKQDFERIQNDKRFADLLAKREKLPAFAARENFMEKLHRSRVVVVVGETGCGKTTQCKRFSSINRSA
jgi:HrpA-like RNA helicase